MNSMVVRRYKNTNVANPIGGYGKPSIGTAKKFLITKIAILLGQTR
jgi:hypothetical protein